MAAPTASASANARSRAKPAAAAAGKGTRNGSGGAVKKRAMQVNVVVRVRPALPHEREQPRALSVTKAGHGKGKGSLLTMTSPAADGSAADVSEFLFDKCYDDATPQRLLFQREIQPAIAKVLDGINTTVFAYGATGTGKTFTMEGSKRNLGMIPRAVKRLFEVADEQKRAFQLDLSYLEIYNDRVLDLLVAPAQQTDLPIRQQPDGTIAVQGLSRSRIASLAEFEALYERGSASRKRAPTEMNPESSRSPSILMIHARAHDAKGREIRFGKLHLIDLAGSEDNRRTGNSGARLAESGKINMSLFVLGKVITALNSGDLQRIPFRDSKLTRLLQDSLGGSNHAVMICNVAQTAGMYTECLQTLNYASKVKGIVNNVTITPCVPAGKTKKATAAPSAKSTTSAVKTRAKVETKKESPLMKTVKAPAAKAAVSAVATSSSMATTTRLPRASTMAGSTATRVLQKTSSLPTNATGVTGAKKASLSPGHPTVKVADAMESKLSAWRQTKQEGRSSIENGDSSASKPAVGLKRPASSALELPKPSSASAGTSLMKKPTSRMSLATSMVRSTTSNEALRVPLQKKSRLSMMPTSQTTARPLARASICPNPAKRSPPSVGSPAGDKENTPANTSASLGTSAVNLLKDLTPVELAKKLIGVAIDLEKKKHYVAAFCVFKRAYHVLPEENPKLVERLKALETECPAASSSVPSQQMSTAVYMQLVLEMDLLDVLNNGAQDQLTDLHSIGDKRAEKIMEARPFAQLSDLLQVQGITDKMLQKLHDHHVQW